MLRLRLPNAPKAEAVRLEGGIVCDNAVIGFAPVPPPRARLLDEVPKAVPSAEKKVVEGKTAGADAPKAVCTVLAIPIPPLVPLTITEDELLPEVFEEDAPPLTVPDMLPAPLDIIVDPPLLPPLVVLCTFVKPSEDSVPNTSEAEAKEEKAKIKASNKNDFNNIWCFMLVCFYSISCSVWTVDCCRRYGHFNFHLNLLTSCKRIKISYHIKCWCCENTSASYHYWQ